MDACSPVSLVRSANMVLALVEAAATAREVPATSGDALVGEAADVRTGSGATPVLHWESTAAQYTPVPYPTEGYFPTVSV